jgi:DNA-binding MarR family transcriptional regulator
MSSTSPRSLRDLLDLEYLDIEIVASRSLDVKRNLENTSPVPEDHIDRFLKGLAAQPGTEMIDLEVEGIVDRVGGINRRIKRAMEATLAEHDLTLPDWQVLTSLRLHREQSRSSPGELAADLELSSGAMTSRLDRLEQAGYVRRLPDPGDRRGIVIELTPEGRAAWDKTAGVQARREAFFASALTKAEQKQLNGLLRKLMLALESREPGKHDDLH